MTKPGPKRKEGARYPSGDLSRAAKHQETAPALIKRMVDRARRGAEDPLLGTVIGVMRLNGMLNDRHLAAAEAYARLRGRCDRMVGFPRRSAQSPAYGQRNGPVAVETDDRVIREVKFEHAEMLRAAGRSYPLLDRVCVDDLAPDPHRLEELLIALDAMAVHFGMVR